MKFLRLEEYKDGRPVVVIEKSIFGMFKWECKYLRLEKGNFSDSWLSLPDLKEVIVEESLIGNTVSASQLSIWADYYVAL